MSSSLSVIPVIAAEIGIKNEDIVAVAVARRERGLELAINNDVRKQKELMAAVTAAQKNYNKLLGLSAAEQWGEKALVLERAFAAFGKSATTTLTPYRGPDEEFPFMVSISCKVQGEHYEYALGTHPIEADEQLELSASSITHLQEQVREVTLRICELKTQMSNIGQTERRARAALAEATLSGSAGGREILDAMSGIEGLMSVPSLNLMLDTK